MFRRMTALATAFLVALSSLGLAPTPLATTLLAQETDAAYEALHDAILAASNNETVLDNTMKAIENAYHTDPNMMALEAEVPGIIAKVVEAMRPTMRDVNDRLQRQYRPALIAVYKKHLTADEARQLADFYSGPVGGRILRQASAGYSPDAMLSDLQSGSAITQEQVDTDFKNAMSSAWQGLSAEDMAAMVKAMREIPALLKLRAVFNEIRVIRVQMENEPPTPEEEARITNAINKVLRENL